MSIRDRKLEEQAHLQDEIAELRASIAVHPSQQGPYYENMLLSLTQLENEEERLDAEIKATPNVLPPTEPTNLDYRHAAMEMLCELRDSRARQNLANEIDKRVSNIDDDEERKNVAADYLVNVIVAVSPETITPAADLTVEEAPPEPSLWERIKSTITGG